MAQHSTVLQTTTHATVDHSSSQFTGRLWHLRSLGPGDVSICQAPEQQVEGFAQTPLCCSREGVQNCLAEVGPAHPIPLCVCNSNATKVMLNLKAAMQHGMLKATM